VAIRTPDSPRLPQPGWRLLGFASIGLGAGLYTADAPFILLAAAFVPAMIAMTVIAVAGATVPSIEERAEELVNAEIGTRRR
jgi:hydrogenase/urease accessory protein HupE